MQRLLAQIVLEQILLQPLVFYPVAIGMLILQAQTFCECPAHIFAGVRFKPTQLLMVAVR